MNKSYSFIIVLLLFLIAILLTIMVSTRGIHVGTDTGTYINFFHGLQDGREYRYEPLFILVSELSADIFNQYQYFFAVLFVIFNFFFLVLYKKIIDKVPVKKGNYVNWFFLLGCVLFSSWYLTATTNGVRHGLSLPLLYLGIFYFFDNKKLKSILFFTISVGFHYSSLLVLPFLPLFFVKPKYYWPTFALVALFYPLGLNESLVKLISDLTGTHVYEFISNYSEGEDFSWKGFSLPFFTYTLGWLVIFLFASKFVNFQNKVLYQKIVKIYSLLMLPYFVFGFGAFSNRFAFICWLFLPILQSSFLVCSGINLRSKIIVAVSLFTTGFIFFYTRFSYF